MITDQELDGVLRLSAPRLSDENVVALSRDVARNVAAMGERPRLNSRTRRTIAIGIAAVCVPSAAAAATVTAVHSHSHAQTAQHLPPGGEDDTSELIDMCAPDFPQFLATLEPRTVTLPKGTTWEMIRTQILASRGSDCPPSGPGSSSPVTGLRLDYVHMSECPWERSFLAAHGRGANEQRRRASRAIVAAEHVIQVLGGDGDGGSPKRASDAARADRTWFAHDYQANCVDAVNVTTGAGR